MKKRVKKTSDTNKRAKSIVDLATREDNETIADRDALKLAAAALGRKGGLKGGLARAKKLSSKRRIEIAKKAAAARWHKKNS